jgi:hypothetical protein
MATYKLAIGVGLGLAALGVIAIAVSPSGMGSSHPGESARAHSGASGCNTEDAFTNLDKFINGYANVKDIDHTKLQIIWTSGGCKGFSDNELVDVIGERDSLRLVQRADGTQLWTHWAELGFASFGPAAKVAR